MDPSARGENPSIKVICSVALSRAGKLFCKMWVVGFGASKWLALANAICMVPSKPLLPLRLEMPQHPMLKNHMRCIWAHVHANIP